MRDERAAKRDKADSPLQADDQWKSRVADVNDDIEVDKEDFKAGMMGHYQIDEQDAGDGSVCSYTGQEHPHPEEMKGAVARIVV